MSRVNRPVTASDNTSGAIGLRQYRAIRAALVGGWLNMLVTDSTTAQWLLPHRD